MIATDAAGKIAYWNDAAEALYGWAKREVLGRDVVDIVPAKISRDEAAAIMEAIVAGDIWSGVFAVRDRKGKQFEAAVTDLPVLKNGKVIGVVGVSKPYESGSPLSLLLRAFAKAVEHLWPGQLDIVLGGGLDVPAASVSDPHMLQLLALILLRQLDSLDQGESLQMAAMQPTRDTLDQFGLMIPAARCVYIRLVRRATAANPSTLREAMRTVEESHYAATLVTRAAGRLFVGSTPAAASATHLFLPVGS